jgi:hypothetical protein
MRSRQGLGRAAGEGGQAGDAFGTSRGALVDIGFARGNGLGVAGAVREAAARALRLRQQGVDVFGADRVHVTEAVLRRAGAALRVDVAGVGMGCSSCCRMKSRTTGYTSLRQRLPEKMP